MSENYNKNHHQAINCPVCLHGFDSEQHAPKIFPPCGHTVCKDCLAKILKMDNPQCPLDKWYFSGEYRTLEDFPTNYLGKDLLERNSNWSQCPLHHEPNQVICLTDNTIICTHCGLFGNHKGHDFKLLLDYKETAQQKKEQLETIAEKSSEKFAKMSSSLKKIHRHIKNIITQRFQILHAAVEKQENNMQFKLDNILGEEKSKLENIKSSLNIKEKLKELSLPDLFSNTNIIKILEEDLADLEKKLSQKLFAYNTQLTEDLLELCKIFQDGLPQEDFLKDFNVFDPLKIQLLKFEEERSFAPEQKQQFFTLDLSASNNKEEIQKLLFTVPNVKEIILDFSNSSITDEVLEEFSVKALPNLDKIQNLEVRFTDSKLTDDGIENFMINLPNISGLRVVGLSSLKVSDNGLRSFVNNKLPLLSNLKNCAIDSENTSISNHLKQQLKKFEEREILDHIKNEELSKQAQQKLPQSQPLKSQPLKPVVSEAHANLFSPQQSEPNLFSQTRPNLFSSREP